MVNPHKMKGLADWAFIAIIVAACSIIGSITAKVSKTPDSPLEQAMEEVVRDMSGRDVDFSAEVKKDEQGNVVQKSVSVNKPTSHGPVKQTMTVKTPFPVTYDK